MDGETGKCWMCHVIGPLYESKYCEKHFLVKEELRKKNQKSGTSEMAIFFNFIINKKEFYLNTFRELLNTYLFLSHLLINWI